MLPSLALVTALTLTAATPALAQLPSAGALVEFGGQMHAGAEACGGYSADQLSTMKAEQRAISQKQGMSASDFDAGFDKGYKEGKARLAALSPAEKKRTCEELKAFSRMQPR